MPMIFEPMCLFCILKFFSFMCTHSYDYLPYTQIINRHYWCTLTRMKKKKKMTKKTTGEKKVAHQITKSAKRDGNQFASSWIFVCATVAFVANTKRETRTTTPSIVIFCANCLFLSGSRRALLYSSYRRIFFFSSQMDYFFKFNFGTLKAAKRANEKKKTNNLFCNQKIIYHNKKKIERGSFFFFFLFLAHSFYSVLCMDVLTMATHHNW